MVEKLLTAAFLFFVGSVLGWGIEVIFRRFVTAKKWINPGFLTGPYLPLYGFGLSGLYAIAQIPIDTGNTVANSVIIIAIMTVAMIFVEYVAGLIFIKGLNIKLWDYSDRKGNIQGIICPLFSFFWLIVSAFYYLVIDRFAIDAVSWFVNNMPFAFVVGLFFGVIIVDFIHSIDLATKIKRFATEHNIVVSYEKFKESVKDAFERGGKKVASFIFPFKSVKDMDESLEEYNSNSHYKKFSIRRKKKNEKTESVNEKENEPENTTDTN